MSILEAGLDALALGGDGRAAGILARYLEEIAFWNPRYRLVAAEGDDLVVKHVLDSLAGLDAIRSLGPESLADLGSGAGLPGIPLAVCLEDVAVTLVERSGRRAGFLRNAALVLGLRNVRVIEAAMEDVKERFDVLAFRAFAPLDAPLIDRMAALLNPGGTIAAYKGRRSALDAELSAAAQSLEEAKVLELSVPFLPEERHLALLRPARREA
jgi:16S rRNA (guanine527-N7)-methyltransferase